MTKRCCRCKKRLGIFSKAYHEFGDIYCGNCLSQKALEVTYDWYSQDDLYYSGHIVEAGLPTNLALRPLVTQEELDSNLNKINNLPPNIKDKILELPQLKIFFKSEGRYNDVPYYVTPNDPIEKRLPIREKSGFYEFYDPIEDTEIYNLVIPEIREIANQKYKEHMRKYFDNEFIVGGIHIYLAIEAHTLYEKYGIYCINNPMSLNHDLFID